MATFTDTWASGSGAEITEPTATEIQQGFQCGPANPGVFNWLFNRVTACINQLESVVSGSTYPDGMTQGVIAANGSGTPTGLTQGTIS